MSERLQRERWPLKMRPKRAHRVHAGRRTSWDSWNGDWIESACGNVTPQHPSNAGLTDEPVDCRYCAKRIARPLTLAQKMAMTRERLAGSEGAGAGAVLNGEWKI